MIKRRNLRTQNVKMFILDEADEMLNRGMATVTTSIPRCTVRGRVEMCSLSLARSLSLFCSGFQEQIYDVYRYLPPTTQVCLCVHVLSLYGRACEVGVVAQVVLVSATLPHEILEMTTKFMTDPIRVLVKR